MTPRASQPAISSSPPIGVTIPTLNPASAIRARALSAACVRLPGLAAAFDGAGEDEAIALLALLADVAPPPGPRLFPPRSRTLVGAEPPGSVHCPLALRTGPDEVARRVEAFRSRVGPDVPFWTADRTLGIRFTIDRTGVSFKAHHPVIQEELLRRCEHEGIDVL